MNGMLLMAAVAGLVLPSGAALGASKPADCIKAGAPETMEGRITKVDTRQGMLTLRAADGTMHDFHASRETLADYKVGDPIKAKLRAGRRCG